MNDDKAEKIALFRYGLIAYSQACDYGQTHRGCSKSTPGESEAEALMACGLSSRDPAHRARSGSLDYRNNPKPARASFNPKKRPRNVS
jgi:hypothetical protein